jgi:hypothetical protein
VRCSPLLMGISNDVVLASMLMLAEEVKGVETEIDVRREMVKEKQGELK